MSLAWHDEAPALPPPPRAGLVVPLSVQGRSSLAEALRRTRPELEKLLVANRVPPLEAYELLLAALWAMPAALEGAHLDRLLVQEVRKSLSARRERDKRWMEQGKAWIDLLVQAGIVLKADRATWLRTIGAHQQR